MGRPRKNPIAVNLNTVKKVDRLPGSCDLVTSVDQNWDTVLKKLEKTAQTYGFSRLDTPVVEDARLYENYFQTGLASLPRLLTVSPGKEPVVLRPEILPSVMRAFCENKVAEKSPFTKWFYSGRVYNTDLQQKGLQEDIQFGFEILGNFTHLNEAQCIAAVWDFLGSVGLPDLFMEINHVGDAQCQKVYTDTVYGFLSSKRYDLCDACNEHLKVRPLNIFRCHNLDCQAVASEAPSILDFLEEASQKHFTSILEALDELGIPYQLSPLHIGPAGSSKTNLAIKAKSGDRAVVLGEAVYHDQLMQQVYGKNFCSFGFSGSLLNIRGLLESAVQSEERSLGSEVFLVPLGELAAKKSLRLFKDLTVQNVLVYDNFGSGGVKNQLKAAETYKAPIALIMGQKEAMDEMVILRDVKSGMQEVISYDKIVEEVKKRLGR